MKKIAFVFLIVGLTSCGQLNQKQKLFTINDVFETMLDLEDQDFEHFTISGDIGGEITSKIGSKVKIPSEAFVFEDGSPVSEEVTLNFREFHSLADILASGINMQYDSAGVSHTLTSGGMVEIRGESEGRIIKVAPGKSLEVQLMSGRDKKDFNLYTMDDSTKQWSYAGQPSSERIAESIFPKKPQKALANERLLDLDLDLSEVDSLKGFKNIMWKIEASKNKNHPDLIFKKLSSLHWDQMLINASQYDNTYTLSVKKGKKKMSCMISPKFVGKEYDQKVSSYRKKVSELRKSELSQEAVYMRSFLMSSFGMVNCDVISRFGSPKRVYVDYYSKDPKKEVVFVYWFSQENSVLVPCRLSELLIYDLETDNNLFAVFSDGSNGMIGAEEFNKLTKDVKENGFVDFTFETLPPLKRKKDLRKEIVKLSLPV